jgi:uncharacterized protein YdhG (YjbR/CyaY superfamily)
MICITLALLNGSGRVYTHRVLAMKRETTKDIWSKKTPPAKDVDAFIEASPKQAQAKLKQLRQIVRTTAPNAEEKISYKMPVYRHNGKWLVGFAGFKNHIGFYGMSGTFFERFKKELKDYDTSKGTIRFPLDKPLPVGLIRKLIKARMKAFP